MCMRKDYQYIKECMGCDNCIHEDDGRWLDFCDKCNIDTTPPGNYRPERKSIFGKVYYGRYAEITDNEYSLFLKGYKYPK